MSEDRSQQERHQRETEAAFRIYRAARDYTKAYEANRSGPAYARGAASRGFVNVLGRMKELAAFCELYQREVPGAREEIAQILQQLADRRGRGS